MWFRVLGQMEHTQNTKIRKNEISENWKRSCDAACDDRLELGYDLYNYTGAPTLKTYALQDGVKTCKIQVARQQNNTVVIPLLVINEGSKLPILAKFWGLEPTARNIKVWVFCKNLYSLRKIERFEDKSVTNSQVFKSPPFGRYKNDHYMLFPGLINEHSIASLVPEECSLGDVYLDVGDCPSGTEFELGADVQSDEVSERHKLIVCVQ